jgi:hypothetical protein
MAIMLIEELYDALLEAGASQEKARLAARAVAGYEDRIFELKTGVTDIRGILRLHSWMLGTSVALLIAILFKVFT